MAKELFLLWDDDGEGSLGPDELMKAFVRIGLSQDHHFARAIMYSIKPRPSAKEEEKEKEKKEKKKAIEKESENGSEKGSEDSSEEEDEIQLQDFIKIFRNDDTSENLIKVINEEVKFQRKQAEKAQAKKAEKEYLQQLNLMTRA